MPDNIPPVEQLITQADIDRLATLLQRAWAESAAVSFETVAKQLGIPRPPTRPRWTKSNVSKWAKSLSDDDIKGLSAWLKRDASKLLKGGIKFGGDFGAAIQSGAHRTLGHDDIVKLFEPLMSVQKTAPRWIGNAYAVIGGDASDIKGLASLAIRNKFAVIDGFSSAFTSREKALAYAKTQSGNPILFEIATRNGIDISQLDIKLPRGYGDRVMLLDSQFTITQSGTLGEGGAIFTLEELPKSLDVVDPKVYRMFQKGGLSDRVVNIVESTKQRLRQYTARALDEGLSPGGLASLIAHDKSGLFSYSRARTIARTESGTALNVSTVSYLDREGIDKVVVFDDEGPNSCEECSEANGQVWDTQYAMDNPLEHPNCVRSFAAETDTFRNWVNRKDEELSKAEEDSRARREIKEETDTHNETGAMPGGWENHIQTIVEVGDESWIRFTLPE